jgi:hypothetical protein
MWLTESGRSRGSGASSVWKKARQRFSIADMAPKAAKHARRNARMGAMLMRLVALKSGGLQLLNHLVMFGSIIGLVALLYLQQPRPASLHASSFLNRRMREAFVPSRSESSAGVLRSMADLVEGSRASPDEYAFVVASPLLLRHVPRADEHYGRVHAACRNSDERRFVLETATFHGVQRAYGASDGELLELGTLHLNTREHSCRRPTRTPPLARGPSPAANVLASGAGPRADDARPCDAALSGRPCDGRLGPGARRVQRERRRARDRRRPRRRLAHARRHLGSLRRRAAQLPSRRSLSRRQPRVRDGEARA